MLVLTKTIKPKALNANAMRSVLLTGMRKMAPQIKKEFEGTTKTWKHKPRFEWVVNTKPSGPEILVGTDDEIYRYVNNGTGLYGPRHSTYEIWAGAYTGKSDKTHLVYASAFTPKTTPGSLTSGAGFRGKPDRRRAMVVHKGIKPRGFTGQIKKIWAPRFKREMEAVMRDVRKASDNGA